MNTALAKQTEQANLRPRNSARRRAFPVSGRRTEKCYPNGASTRYYWSDDSTLRQIVGRLYSSMSYDVHNRLTQVAKSGFNTEQYTYDHQGRRISKNPGAGLPVRNYLYDGDNIYGDYGSWTNPPSYLYVHGPNTDEPLISLQGGTTPYFYHQDGLGSVVALTVPTGVFQIQLFDTWGNRLTPGSPIPQYGYTGREPEENGLLYYRARHYDPTIGRFLQRDPIGFGGGLNMYAYVSNNPTNLTDPSGLAPPPNLHLQSNVNSQAVRNAAYNAMQNGSRSGTSSSYDPFTNMGGRMDVTLMRSSSSSLSVSGSSFKATTRAVTGNNTDKSNIVFSVGPQVGASGRVGAVKINASVNAGRIEYGLAKGKAVSESYQVGVEIMDLNLGFNASRGAPGSPSAGRGNTIRDKLDRETMVYAPLWGYKEGSTEDKWIVDFGASFIIGIDVKLDFTAPVEWASDAFTNGNRWMNDFLYDLR